MTLAYFVRRTLQSLLLLLLVTIVVFSLLRLTPGDPATIMLGENAEPEQIAALKRAMGLDKPIYEQYIIYLGKMLQGDFGQSIRAQRPALEYVLERFPATIQLSLSALVIALIVGMPIGIVSAVKRYTLWDRGSMFVALLGQSIPGFWLGLMLISIFAVQLKVLPVSGRGDIRHLVLPGATLAAFLLGLMIRLTRSGMLDVLEQDFIRTARAKGLSSSTVLLGHALKNALIPIVTVLGLQIGVLLSGAVITETVFAWPGVGNLAVTAIYQRDYPLVQVVVLISATVFVFINWAVDMLYHVLDPRVRVA